MARTAERIKTDKLNGQRAAPEKLSAAKMNQTFERSDTPIPNFQIGASDLPIPKKPKTASLLSDEVARLPIEMDQKAYGKLRRGKLRPEARIDLHGMTLAQAQPTLIGFILRAQTEGKRLVLVITGKGKAVPDDGPIPVRRGILRHAVPQWLRSAPLDRAVLQISEAHAKHGGGGAYYVYLRRQR